MNGYHNISLNVGPEDNVKRIDQFISESTGISRSQVQKMIEIGNITISGSPVKKNHKVKQGEVIIIEPLPGESDTLIPQKIDLEVVYEDKHLIVINKPPGIVMYPAAGHAQNTLMNGLAYHCDHLASIGAPLRPGVVHRLDKDTSGIVVVALTNQAYYSLRRQFKERTITRNYRALVNGRINVSSGKIDAPIGRALSDRKKMSTKTRSGKIAITHYTVMESFSEATLVSAKLATGRTHQIRVHFASIGHPVIGDRTYGRKTLIRIYNKTIKVPRQMLHAHTLEFIHPVSEEEKLFTSSLPQDMEEILEMLRE